MKKGGFVCTLLTLVLWQFFESLKKIILNGKNFETPLFSTVTTTNNGAAFGILDNYSYLLGGLGVIVLVFIFLWAYKNLKFDEKGKILTLSAFCAGVLGNTAERLYTGRVLDFIKIKFFDFPVFNLFDILICTGAFLFIFFFLKEEKNEN